MYMSLTPPQFDMAKGIKALGAEKRIPQSGSNICLPPTPFLSIFPAHLPEPHVCVRHKMDFLLAAFLHAVPSTGPR